MDEGSPRPTDDDLEKRQLLAQLQGTMFGREEAIKVGRYVLREKLGSGAMGVVYLADDPQLRRPVALKVLHPDKYRADADSGHERLKQEAKSLSQVIHPNVIEVFDVGDSDGRVYIAMELVHGVSLETWLQRESRRRSEVLAVFLSAARGLAAAHRAGVVHRDFKPSNVQVGDDGRVCVLDFGLAKAARVRVPTLAGESDGDGVATMDGARVGTPKYMAPEQLRGEAADAASDQFAFCVALYEGLTGSLPFDPERMLETKSTGEGVGAVHAGLRRGLSPEPARRFSSMDALIAALDVRPSRGRALVAAALLGGVGLSAAWLWPRPPEAVQLQAANYLLLRAHAKLMRGRRLTGDAEHKAAVQVLEAAHADAVTARDDRVRVAAAIELARIAVQQHADVVTGERWFRDAQSAVERVDGQPQLTLAVAQVELILARSHGDLHAAEQAARDVLSVARAELEGHNVGIALHGLGVVLFEQRRFADAREALTEAISIAEGLPPGELLADCWLVLAAVDSMDAAASRNPAMRQQSVVSGRRAVEAMTTALGPDSSSTINARLNFAIVLAEAGHSAEAKTELERAVKALQAVAVPDEGALGIAYENLGLLALDASDLETAEDYLQRAAIAIATAKGAEHPAMCTVLDHLGDVQRRRGKLDLARASYTRALAIAEQAGPGAVAGARNGLAGVEEDAGNHQRAAELYDAAADAYADAIGPESDRAIENRRLAARARAR